MKNISIGSKYRNWMASEREVYSVIWNGKIFYGNETVFGYCTGNYGKSGYYTIRRANEWFRYKNSRRNESLFLKLRDEGKTILLASHNEEEINQLCNCIYKIENGRAYTYPF